jgi:hypothetical protein
LFMISSTPMIHMILTPSFIFQTNNYEFEWFWWELLLGLLLTRKHVWLLNGAMVCWLIWN